MDDALSVEDLRNAKSLFFKNLYLVEAYSKKKKIKVPGLAEGREPENHEAPAKGITCVIWKALPSRVGGGGESSL